MVSARSSAARRNIIRSAAERSEQTQRAEDWPHHCQSGNSCLGIGPSSVPLPEREERKNVGVKHVAGSFTWGKAENRSMRVDFSP